MKRYLGIIVAIAFVVVSVVFAYNKYKNKSVEADREANASRIRVEYMERVGWIRANPEPKAYQDEVGTFFRWYFNQVNDHLNRYAGNRDFDDYLKELDKRSEKGGKEQQLADKKAYYDYVRKIFDQMKAGSYAPVWSGTDKGMRLDVLSTEAVTVAGQPQVRYQLVVWGAQREMREEGKIKKMHTSASFSALWKLFDEKGKLVGEMNAPGDPSMKIDFPERFIAQFPPQMVIGHYDIDLLPAEVKAMEITFNVNSRSQSGGDILASYTWKLDAPAEWKLRPGEEWKGAQESVRPEDEIDPSKRAMK
ncbi:MAG: hypothetical protein ACOZIN_02690 [Myxococcota bacterium]